MSTQAGNKVNLSMSVSADGFVAGPNQDEDNPLAGGASCAQQALKAGLVDEVDLQVSPVILGAGERLLDGFEPGEPELELVRVLEAPGTVHIRYRVVK